MSVASNRSAKDEGTVLGVKRLRSGEAGKKFWEEDEVPLYKRHEVRGAWGVKERSDERREEWGWGEARRDGDKWHDHIR
jgi:hypothetical protein